MRFDAFSNRAVNFVGVYFWGGFLLCFSYDVNTGFVGALYFLVTGIAIQIEGEPCPSSPSGDDDDARRSRRLQFVCHGMHLGYNGSFTPSNFGFKEYLL